MNVLQRAEERHGPSEGDDFEARCNRVRLVLRAAQRLADPHDDLGKEARRLLPAQTGLSPAGVELGLRRHLETSAPDALLGQLVRCVPEAGRVHVVLSANVFVGAVRALALALGSAPRICIKASRREPVTASLIVRALAASSTSPSVRIVDAIEPTEGDAVHAYGRQSSLDAIARSLAPGVRLWTHGPGMGVVLAGDGDERSDAATQLSWDVIAFDQRGCLSPRLVIWLGTLASAHAFAARLAQALASRQDEVPRGALEPEDATQAALYVRSMQMVGRCWHSDHFAVGVEARALGLTIPPAGRHVHIVCIPEDDPLPGWVIEMAPFVTTIGIADSMRSHARAARTADLVKRMPGARVAELGQMQRPPFDGPVDRRACFQAPRVSAESRSGG
jgi:hypothetical protein